MNRTLLAFAVAAVLTASHANAQTAPASSQGGAAPPIPPPQAAPYQEWRPGEAAPRNTTIRSSLPANGIEVQAPADITRRVPAIAPNQPVTPAAAFAPTPTDPQAVALAAAAQPPPPINLLSDKDSTLNGREALAVRTAKEWIEGDPLPSRDAPARGDHGAVVFRMGAVMPTIVCAPLFACDVQLQPGEAVNDVHVGDNVRWKVTPAISGTGAARVTHAIIKPTDIGLTTNLVITTDRRTYSLKLVSRKDDWMPTISFSYPEEEAAQWAAVAQAVAQERAQTVIPETGQSVANLDFGYRLKGDAPRWKPLRVYTDGQKTYIQFPQAIQSTESPALLAIGPDKKEQLVNYRVAGDRYVVDKVLERAMLVSGVGRHQVKVRIERTGEA